MITGAFLAMFKQKGRNLDYTVLAISVTTFVLTLLAVYSGEPTSSTLNFMHSKSVT